MKLSCAIIARHAPQLERAVASIRPMVDEVVVVWTGPEDVREIPGVDRSEVFLDVNRAQDCLCGCGSVAGDFMDFGAARNRSWDLTTGDAIVWIDADDVLESPKGPHVLRECAASMGDGIFMFPYDYYQDGRSYPIPRLGRRHHRWVLPIHETMGAATQLCNDVKWVHKRTSDDNARSIVRNVRIATHWRNDPRYVEDARFQFYLGQSLKDIVGPTNGAAAKAREAGDAASAAKHDALAARYLDEAIQAFGRSFYCDGYWEERYLSAEWASHLETERGNYREALVWACRSQTVACSWSQSSLLVGKALYHLSRDRKNDVEKKALARQAVRILRAALEEQQGQSILPYPLQVHNQVHRYLNVMLFELGDLQGSLESCEAGLAIEHDDTMLSNVAVCKAYLGRYKLQAAVTQLSEAAHLARERGQQHATNIVDESWREVADHIKPFLPQGAAVPGAKREAKRIAFVCGFQWVKWTPETGAPGGSEIAIVEVTKRLAKRGYDVHVFSEPGVGKPTVFDGVTWHPSAYADDAGAGEFDVLIGWRGLDRVEGGKAPRRFLWMHDMDIQHVTPKRIAMIDGVIVNSRWHEDVARKQLPGKAFHVCGAGLDPSKLQDPPGPAGRNPYQCFWSSSFDRGLDFMVDIWPMVRALVPEATLAVAYGFDGSLNMAKKNTDAGAIERIETLWKRCESTGGVRLLNGGKRVPEDEYFQHLVQSGVWAYPIPASGNNFGETFCASGAEAICAGLRLVISPRGALEEVASPFAFRQVYGRREDASYRTEFATAICEAMESPREGPDVAAARARFDWDRVVDRWVERVLQA